MEQTDYFIGIAQQTLCITALAAALAIGILLGMVQAATSINEATLSFVPKLIVVGAMLALFGGSILYLIADFTIETFNRIPELLV
jgi:flagellar biosynthetic protein FliQ